MKAKLQAFLLSLVLLLASFAISELLIIWQQPQWLTTKGLGKVAIFVLLAGLLLASLRSVLGRVLLAFLWLLEFSQLYYYQFFRQQFSGADIAIGLAEYQDVAGSALGMWRVFTPAIFASLVSLALIFWVIKRTQNQPVRHFGAVLAGLILLLHGYKIADDSIEKAMPEHRNPVVYNALNASASYIAHFMLADAVPKEVFLPYQFTDVQTAVQPNVILYIGESLNPKHMSNFGYARETTPRLHALEQQNQGFHKLIYSAGVFTRVSTPMLLAVVREPQNIQRYKTAKGHLVSTAKAKGYKTWLVSNQTLDFMASTAVISDYDVFIDWQVNRKLNQDNFVDFVQQLNIDDQQQPVFMVLNSRAPHSPYEEHIRPETAKYSLQDSEDHDQELVNEYDDALRSADRVMGQSLQKVLARLQRPTVVVVTSDHGQLVNDDGEFGHGRLEQTVAEVPLLVWFRHWPDGLEKPSFSCVQNHFQLGSALLKVLGVTLHNPNAQHGEFYVNGSSLYGQGKVMRYRLPGCDLQAQF